MATVQSGSRIARYKMVIGLDLSEYSDAVLEAALDQAGRHALPELHILTVVEPTGAFRRSPRRSLDSEKEQLGALVLRKLDDFGRAGENQGDWRIRLHVRRGHPADEIANLAVEARADLIVVGRFGVHRAEKRHYVGSVADRVLVQAPCPTLVVQMTEDGARPDEDSCPACVAIRRDSDGERWFCAEHHAGEDDVGVATLLLPRGSLSLGGLPMW